MKIPGFLTLAPDWIMFDQFWISLKKRNVWMIYLRYGAAAMLALMAAGAGFLVGIGPEPLPLLIIAGVVLLYNLLFHRYSKFLPETYAPFNGLHFALLQMSIDFVALMLIIYYTGGIESPFYAFFVFHIILGSLILPGRVVVVLICVTLLVTLTGALLELQGFIPHRAMGLFSIPFYNNPVYLGIHFSVIAATLFVSNYLANSISKELYQRERALNIAYNELEEAERNKSRYVMSVVHDLKTPIAVAITYLNMILDGSLGKVAEAVQKPLERTRIRLNGAITTIGDILQFSQVKLTAESVPEQVNLRALLDEIYQEMRIMFQAKQIRYSIWMGDDEFAIEAERRLLKLALANVVSNAHKYSGEGGKVEIHVKELDGKVRIEVADSGMGISVEDQEKVFQDFYRTANARKAGIEGTGLGLSLVLHIIQRHHGEIGVESPSRLSDGKDRPGTAFIIVLPKTAPHI